MRCVLLALAFALAAAFAPTASAAPYPSTCTDVVKPGSDCDGALCVTWDAIPWMGACVRSVGDVCDWTVLCQPCTCPPLRSEADLAAVGPAVPA